MFAVDIQNLVNLAFSILIFILGLRLFEKTKKPLPLFIAIAFACFGVSHFAVVVNMAFKYADFLTILRSFAYILVIYALYTAYTEKK